VRVQICDEKCEPLPGYSFDDCEEIRGDHISIEPKWRAHKDIEDAMKHGWIRLMVELEQADIFSISGDFGIVRYSGASGFDHL